MRSNIVIQITAHFHDHITSVPKPVTTATHFIHRTWKLVTAPPSQIHNDVSQKNRVLYIPKTSFAESGILSHKRIREHREHSITGFGVIFYIMECSNGIPKCYMDIVGITVFIIIVWKALSMWPRRPGRIPQPRPIEWNRIIPLGILACITLFPLWFRELWRGVSMLKLKSKIKNIS